MAMGLGSGSPRDSQCGVVSSPSRSRLREDYVKMVMKCQGWGCFSKGSAEGTKIFQPSEKCEIWSNV